MVDRWFWQPDKAWVNEVNTTALRSIQGIRLSTGIFALGAVVFLWASWHAVPHCPVEPCVESVARQRAQDFALGVYDSLCIFVTALMGIAVGGLIGKRVTDTEHRVRVEEAKAKAAVQTSEHPAVKLQANDNATVTVKQDAPGNGGAVGEEEEHSWADREPKEGLG